MPVGVETVWIHSTDFDADGKDDLFLSTNGENSVSIVWGRADGALTDVDTYVWGKPGYWLGSGDIDNDGHLDALLLPDVGAIGAPGLLRVHFGDGRRRFERERDYRAPGFDAVFAAVADVDGDRLHDVLLLGARQRCVWLMRGLGGGDLSEPRCIHRFEESGALPPSFTMLGRDAQGRAHALSYGAPDERQRRPLVRWVFAANASAIERIDTIESGSASFGLVSIVKGASGQRVALRIEADPNPRRAQLWLRTIGADLTVRECERSTVALQTDGAGPEQLLTSGDFDGDGKVDHFGLTSWCTRCPGMLYVHLGR